MKIRPNVIWTLLGAVIFSIVMMLAYNQRVEAVQRAAEIKMYSVEKKGYVMTDTVSKSKEEWKKVLTKEQFHILREKGTEAAFSGKYANHHEQGVYRCAGCGLDLFRSEDKFESGTGWPSFTAPIAAENVQNKADNSLFMRRTEVLCPRCGGHLGHVFDDGPKPIGQRYCMNSAALQFAALPQK